MARGDLEMDFHLPSRGFADDEAEERGHCRDHGVGIEVRLVHLTAFAKTSSGVVQPTMAPWARIISSAASLKRGK